MKSVGPRQQQVRHRLGGRGFDGISAGYGCVNRSWSQPPKRQHSLQVAGFSSLARRPQGRACVTRRWQAGGGGYRRPTDARIDGRAGRCSMIDTTKYLATMPWRWSGSLQHGGASRRSSGRSEPAIWRPGSAGDGVLRAGRSGKADTVGAGYTGLALTVAGVPARGATLGRDIMIAADRVISSRPHRIHTGGMGARA